MGIELLESLVGRKATATKLLLPGERAEPVMSRSGVLRFAHVSDVAEYDLVFDSGYRITLVPGDAVTVAGKRHTLI
ncbi:hypothetical protein ACTXJR_02755 [Glutamicibacter ardleyensis]|uniref:hypothetical protein n=1 Tax=Glutamicibacter ardleyensis TaxID=225894 RepID=UPI003FD3B647